MTNFNKIDNYFNIAATGKIQQNSGLISHRRLKLLKISLSSIASVLILILIILPQIQDNIKEFSIDFVVEKSDLEQMNVEKTNIYITDNKNKVSNLSASNIKETAAGSQIYNLTEPEALTPTTSGEWISIKSPTGVFNQKTSVIHLSENVEGFYSKGMNIQTSEAFFDFNKSFGHSDTPVTGDGFLGRIDAKGFKFDATNNILTFIGPAHIVIDEENIKKEQ